MLASHSIADHLLANQRIFRIVNRKLNIFYTRVTVNIIIAYMLLFNTDIPYKNWAYLFVALFFLSNLVIYNLPDDLFREQKTLYIICGADTVALAVGIFLTANSGTSLYIAYFFIISLAAMSMNLKYLVTNTFLFIAIYGWILHMNGQLVGDLFTLNFLKLPFILTVSALFGYIVQCILYDINKFVRIGNYALNNSLNGIILTDFNGDIKFANPSFLDMINSEKSRILGTNISSLLPGHENRQTLLQSVASGSSWRGEIHISCKSKALSELKAAASTICDESSNALCYMISFEDITRRKNAERRLKRLNSNLELQIKERTRELERLSLSDNVTGLYNRNFFERELKRLSGKDYFPMGIIVCDVNGLKLINDTLGHHKGDELLKLTANILQRRFRTNDIVARIGGDEFAVLLPQTDEETVRDCCRRIREEVDQYNENNPEFGISISLGYTVSTDPDLDLNEIFKRADDAMYKEKRQQTLSSRSQTVQALIKTMEARDYVTQGHANRLYEYVYRLGKAVGLSRERLSDLRLLARFHDLGKVGVPDRILFKRDSLTQTEFQEMQTHCEIGHRIALSTSDLAPIADLILKHHESWDGSGYPHGLQMEQIPLECRILAIADAYDAMTNNRPYRIAMTHEEAVSELRSCAGTQFDPELVEKFIRILEEPGEA